MITEINNSTECRKFLNETLFALQTKAKSHAEIKNAINLVGKFLADVKMEMLNKDMIGDFSGVTWFDGALTQRLLNMTEKQRKKLAQQ